MGRRQGLVGYGLLLGLIVLGLGGALGLGGLGLAAYFQAADRPMKAAHDAPGLASALEGALVLWSFGILSLLVAITSFVVLLKGLSDDVAGARRGPIEGAGGEGPGTLRRLPEL